MERIWILIFVGVMLFKAFQKITDIKAKLPGDRQHQDRPPVSQERPPVFRETSFPWETDYQYEYEDEHEDEGSGQMPGQGWKRSARAREPIMAETETGKTLVERTAPNSAHTREQRHRDNGECLPLLNSDGIINGIIFSEILQPPKSKRRIRKPY